MPIVGMVQLLPRFLSDIILQNFTFECPSAASSAFEAFPFLFIGLAVDVEPFFTMVGRAVIAGGCHVTNPEARKRLGLTDHWTIPLKASDGRQDHSNCNR